MGTARLIEQRITRDLLARQGTVTRGPLCKNWTERTIAVLAAAAGLCVVGSFFEEMLWAALAAATLVTLR